MTKAQLVALANAKDVKVKELRRKTSEYRMYTVDPPFIDLLLIQFNHRGTKGYAKRVTSGSGCG